MSDLISRKALIEKLKKSIKWCEDNLESSTASFQSGCIAAIKDVISTVKMEETCPSVDAVEVVRCVKCKHSYETILGPGCEPLCGLVCAKGVCVDCIVPEDFYCSYGERKEVTHEKT